MRYTQIPTNTFSALQLNAGIVLADFDVTDGSFEDTDLLGATSGGVNVTATPEFSDFGEDVDNCPKNDEYSKTDYMMVFRGTLQVSFNNIVTDCGIKTSAVDKEYFKEIEDKMLNHFKTKTIYRFLHGTNLTRELYERISKPLNDIYSDLDKNDIQFEQIFNVKTNDGDCVVEYYDGNDIIVLHMGTEKFAYTFVILL